MSDVQTVVPIPDLEPADLPISGIDLVIIGQGGLAKRTTVDDLFGAGVPNPMPAVDGSAVLVTATGSSEEIDLADRAAEVISVKDYGAKGDLRFLTGTITFSGSLVTISGAAFTVADIGKWMVLPAGGSAGIAVLRQISAIGPDGTQAIVSAAATSSFVGGTTQLNNGLSPDQITFNARGTDYSIGDVLTLVGGTFTRAGTVKVTLLQALSATVVSAGTLGPASTLVVLTATTGYGKRAQFTTTLDSNGTVSGALTLLTAGALWYDATDPANEPVTALPLTHTTTATFASGSHTVVVASASGLFVGNPIVADGIPSGTAISAISGTTLTINGSGTTAAKTATTCLITNNSSPISTTATYASGSTSVVVASATGLKIGYAVAGPGIPGSGDPTDTASTRITGISGTTITLSAATTAAAVQPASFTAYPMLTGAVISVAFGIAAACFDDPGVYSVAPTYPAAVTGGTGTGATLTTFTTAIRVPLFTDDTAAINVATALCRSLVAAQPNTLGAPVVLDFPADIYGCLSPINLTGIRSRGFKIDGNGAQIYSCAAGGIAVDFFNSRWYVLEGPFYVYGDQYFSPRIGTAHAQVGVNSSAPISINGLTTDGSFDLCSTYLMGTESSILANLLLYNRSPVTGSYGLICDGYNHFAVSSTFIPQTLPADFGVSFISLDLPNVSAIHTGAGSPFWFGKVNDLRAEGYGAGYGPPGAVFLLLSSVSGSPSSFVDLSIHFETTSLQDSIFFTSQGGAFFIHGLRYVDQQPFTNNSLLAADTLGAFGSTCAALSLFDTEININAITSNVLVFDSPQVVVFEGSVTLSNISNTPHWNEPSSFKGKLVLERVVRLYVETLNATSMSVNQSMGIGGALTVQSDVTTQSRFLVGVPGTSASVIIGGDGNGNIALGSNGTVAQPSVTTPYIQWFGPDNIGSYDARVICSSAGVLTLSATTRFDVTAPTRFTSTTGFNNTAPISKPTVTGSKGSNAALTSLLTALANYGLVTDSTS